MIKQPDKGMRDINDLFYETEARRINKLNREFFQDIELTKKENSILVWLCGLDDYAIDAIVSAFAKILCRGGC